jgi:hypothetical protein
VLAQTNVGQVLDGGAEKLTAAEFKKQIVGRFITGPGMRADSGTIEVVYLDGGVIRGAGAASPLGGALGGGGRYDIEGTWTIDEQDRICQSIRIGNVALAPKCQYWFKQAEKYYLADSDSDRSARVSIRTVKKT